MKTLNWAFKCMQIEDIYNSVFFLSLFLFVCLFFPMAVYFFAELVSGPLQTSCGSSWRPGHDDNERSVQQSQSPSHSDLRPFLRLDDPGTLRSSVLLPKLWGCSSCWPPLLYPKELLPVWVQYLSWSGQLHFPSQTVQLSPWAKGGVWCFGALHRAEQ